VLFGMRLVVGPAMALSMVLGLLALTRRDFAAHGAWLTRGYALGFGAGTQVLTYFAVMIVAGVGGTLGRTVSMGAGWAINLVVAEWLIARRAARRAAESTLRATLMEAAVFERYGGPEVLELRRVVRPEPGPGQVRVRVRATSINAADYRLMRANPFLARLHLGLLRPRRHILGMDVAGVVDAVGSGVTAFKPGDAVMGAAFFDGYGAFAEAVCVREDALVPLPRGLDFVQAAAMPLIGLTVLQALRDQLGVKPGQSVLVHGAGGGIGTLAVQLAHALGARVTAVCGPGSVALVRSLGADVVIDYSTSDFSAAGEQYDAILGVNGSRPLAEYLQHLKPGGTYLMVGGSSRQIFEALLRGPLATRFDRQGRKVRVLTLDGSRRAEGLAELRRLLEEGALKPVIDRVFPLREIRAAMQYVERGHVRGKVVLEVPEKGSAS